MLAALLRLWRLSLALFACACTTLADLAQFSPTRPNIPARDFHAADLGVSPGSSAPVTAALQAALDHVAAAGGGRLVITPGDYLCGPLRLPGKLDLHLTKGTILRLLPLSPDYPVADGRYASFITAADTADIRLSGEGLIDGGGETWWRAFRASELSLRRPQLIALTRCERIEFTGFTTLNPPNTHFALRLCRDVTFREITVKAPDESANTDGLNISGKNYLIERCRISTGDDNIVILTHSAPDWSSPVCENFTIRDCTLGYGHGLSIGSQTGGGIRGLLAERITFQDTTSGIRLKAARERGGLVEDLVYRDIVMQGVKNPVFISSYYPKEPNHPSLDSGSPITAQTPRWKDILIENLHVTDAEHSLILWGLPELPLGNITVRNTSIASRSPARLYHAPNLVLEQVEFESEHGPNFERWPTSDPVYRHAPLIGHRYSADPSAHVIDGRLWLYPSHDVPGVTDRTDGNHYAMRDYHVYSLDRVGAAVTDHGIALALADIPWASRQLWAPDIALAHGRYYFYFPARDHDQVLRIGVAVGNSPAGPFVAQPEPITGAYSIDPAVFRDHDGSHYLYFGGIGGGQLQHWTGNDHTPHAAVPAGAQPACLPRIARLRDDMLGLAEPARELPLLDPEGRPLRADDEHRRFFEGAWMHHHADRYYFSYSTGTTHQIAYATGTSPYGPFTYHGTILQPVKGWTTHHSIVHHEGKWWLFYHDAQLSGESNLRNVKVCELHHEPDGSIRPIDPFVPPTLD